ncbi:MAG: hypothetical protein FWD68_18675 [Alphaproteobacteria bacterium]|nr:hypothetical protein [Alphaproteobacteria bacterium]
MAKDRDKDRAGKWNTPIGMGPDGVHVIGYTGPDGKVVVTNPPPPIKVVNKDGFYVDGNTGDFVDANGRPSPVPVKHDGPMPKRSDED